MNRRDLVKAIAAQTEVDAKTVDAVLKGFTDVTTAVVTKGEPVAITGFAKFAKVERAARMGRNPATGEAIQIKASKKARITPLKGFKDAVMTPSQAPKLNKGVFPRRLIRPLDARAVRSTPGRFSVSGTGPALPFPGSCPDVTSIRASGSAIAGPRCSPSTATRPSRAGCCATTAWPCRSRRPTGERMVKLRRGVEPLTVGDWLALDGEQVLGLLDRASLLRRRAAGGEDPQLLAANLDLVLLVCGLDRPVTAGRIQRGEALAWDAGAHPVLVLTKADLADDLDGHPRHRRRASTPGSSGSSSSSVTGLGIDELRDRLAGHTSVLLGESGAGKSRLVNAVLGTDAAVVGAVRDGDRKGRHTTTNRQLHLLAGGGVVIDSPGIREVGLAGDEESVDATFADIDELGEECHFTDCGHAGEPGCAIALAVTAGELSADRLGRLPGRSARRRPRPPAGPTSTSAAPTSAASRRP